VTTPEEDVIRAECEDWASGLLFMDSDEKRKELRDRVCANPDTWWRILQDLIAEAPDDRYVQKLAYAPFRMTLECGGQPILQEAMSIARSSSKMASAMALGAPSEMEVLFGREFLVDTLIRYYARHIDFDFWAWETVMHLVKNEPGEAWPVILDLVENAPDDKVLGVIAAGEIEDFIMAHAPEFIDRIEAEARDNVRFKEALAGIWIMRLQPDLFDRVEKAAGVPLRRL